MNAGSCPFPPLWPGSMPTTSPANGRRGRAGLVLVSGVALTRGVAPVTTGTSGSTWWLTDLPGALAADAAGLVAPAVLQPAVTSTIASTDQQIRGLLCIPATLAPLPQVRCQEARFHPRIHFSLCSQSRPASSAVAAVLGSRSVHSS